MSSENIVTQGDHWVTMACPICGVGKSEPCIDTMGHRHPSSHPERRVWSTFARHQPQEREAVLPTNGQLYYVAEAILQTWEQDPDTFDTKLMLVAAIKEGMRIAALKTTPAPAECNCDSGKSHDHMIGCAVWPTLKTTPAPAVPTDEICDHEWRFSDSSLYDFKCTKCGEVD